MWKKYRIFWGILIGAVTATIIIYGTPYISQGVSQWGTPEILVTITLIGVFATVAVPFIEKWIKKDALYCIDIHVSMLSDNTALFSASIENVGDKTITPLISNLYIDQGIKTAKENNAYFYDFPFILQHNVKENQPDCILCTRCKNKELTYPIDNIDDRFKQKNKPLYRANIELQHLSEKSIKYIHPKEKFSEDVVMQFEKNGVYRVTFIVTTEEADCQCATKQFVVPELKEKITTQNNEKIKEK